MPSYKKLITKYFVHTKYFELQKTTVTPDWHEDIIAWKKWLEDNFWCYVLFTNPNQCISDDIINMMATTHLIINNLGEPGIQINSITIDGNLIVIGPDYPILSGERRSEQMLDNSNATIVVNITGTPTVATTVFIDDSTNNVQTFEYTGSGAYTFYGVVFDGYMAPVSIVINGTGVTTTTSTTTTSIPVSTIFFDTFGSVRGMGDALQQVFSVTVNYYINALVTNSPSDGTVADDCTTTLSYSVDGGATYIAINSITASVPGGGPPTESDSKSINSSFTINGITNINKLMFYFTTECVYQFSPVIKTGFGTVMLASVSVDKGSSSIVCNDVYEFSCDGFQLLCSGSTTTSTTSTTTSSSTTLCPTGTPGLYGYLYNKYAINDFRSVANAGWRVAEQGDWQPLLGDAAGLKLVLGLPDGWKDPIKLPSITKTNSTKFSAYPSGQRTYIYEATGFSGANELARYHVRNLPYIFSIYFDATDQAGTECKSYISDISGGNYEKEGYAVRLVKTDDILTKYVGNDGQVYDTVRINDKIWTIENLRETLYYSSYTPGVSNDPIPEVQCATDWWNLTSGARCIYPRTFSTYTTSSTTTKTPVDVNTWGYLYNVFAILDRRNIANTGWRIPTEADMNVLIGFVGNNSNSLKSTVVSTNPSTAGWYAPNTGTNTTGFSAVGSGRRSYTGDGGILLSFDFYSIDWGSTDTVGIYTFYSSISTIARLLLTSSIAGVWQEGRAIRLIKEDSTLASYTGNDGTVYPTVKIGNQVWTSVNIRETRYRNGDVITLRQNKGDWDYAIDGARCLYEP